MSFAAMTWVMDDAELLTVSEFAVLVVYANYANEDGRSYPSSETVTKKSRQNIKTVRSAIDSLEARGLLADTGRRVGRTGNVKVYRLGMQSVPDLGTLQGETANPTEEAAQEPRQRVRAKAPPKTVPFKVPVSGSKPSRFRVAEPVLEPSTPEEASASSAPQGARNKHGSMISEDWQVPELAELPDHVRDVAAQWPDGAYAAYGDQHRRYWAGQSGRRARRRDWDAAWHARVLDLGARPMREAKAGLRFVASAFSDTAAVSVDQLERTAALFQRMGRADDAADMRRQAAAARSG